MKWRKYFDGLEKLKKAGHDIATVGSFLNVLFNTFQNPFFRNIQPTTMKCQMKRN